jgi:serine/threonine protein kinase
MNTPRVSWQPPSVEATAVLKIRYDPVAEIGAGGMGTVVLARALSGPSAGTYVALKRLFPHLEEDPLLVDAFLNEVWLISSLHHPHVVEPLDWGRDDQGSYLAMQFVPGDSLRALVRARELAQCPLPLEVVVEIAACAAAGLHAAHELKSDRGDPLCLVHRDVSPANVLIGYDGSVKLIDFGVAKVAGKAVHTQNGLIKGKFGYMSPEQLQGLPLDRRADVFSLGVVLWEMLTLCRLYSGASDYDLGRMVCEEDAVPPSELRGDVPPELDRIVLRCLAKAPADRYATCAELAHDLAPLRAPRAQARHAIAAVARESMPARLQWIEQVLRAPVPLIEPPLAVAPDTTVPTEPPTPEVLERLSAPVAGPPEPVWEPESAACVVPGSPTVALPEMATAFARSERWRRTLLFGALAAVGVVSAMIGVWLGQR